MTAKQAWKEFYARVYETEYPKFSDLLGSDWGMGSNVNQTGSQYRGAAYRRMIVKYGEEPNDE